MKFEFSNIPFENHGLPYVCWLPRMLENSIKSRFIISPPKLLINSLASTIKWTFLFNFLVKYKHITINVVF